MVMKNLVQVFVLTVVILSNSACTHSVLWNKYFKDGMREFQAGNYGDAENLLGLALRQANHSSLSDDDRILSIRALGVAQLALGKSTEALTNFESVNCLITQKKGLYSIEYAENLEDIGLSLAKLKKYTDASARLSDSLACYEHLKVKDSSIGRLLQSLAYCQQKSGNPDAAAAAYARYFASQNLANSADGNNDLSMLKEYRKILAQLKMKTELAKTDAYMKKLGVKKAYRYIGKA